MTASLRLLLVEDSEDDALLLVAELEGAGYEVEFERVETAEALNYALDSKQWDLIIADYSMPHFSGPEALAILKEKDPDIPFILVSGTVREQEAVRMMREGAKDFILKQEIARLVPAVARELQEAEVRRERSRAERELRESEERFRLIAETATDALIMIDESSTILYVNPAAERVFGYSNDEMLDHSITMLMLKDQRQSHISSLQEYVSTGRKHIDWGGSEVVGLHKSGREIQLEVSYGEYSKDNQRVFIGIVRDITERKLAEQREREVEDHKLEFYRRTIYAATGGKLIITDKEKIEQEAGLPIASWDIHEAGDIPKTRHGVTEAAKSLGMDEKMLQKFISSLGEAATNAVKHASGGMVTLHKMPEGLLFAVTDNGMGIPALRLPDVALLRRYSTLGTLGMGYKLILLSSDRVYLATGPNGTTVACLVALTESTELHDLADFASVGSF